MISLHRSSLLFVVTFSLASAAFAGEKAGNGGKIVICPGRGPEVLDYQRAKNEFGLAPIADVAGKDAFEKTRALIARLKTVNPTRAAIYAEWLKTFLAEADFISDADFPETMDTNHIAYCRGGTVRQAITQRRPLSSFEKRYLVNGDLWKKLSPFQSALLIFHELAVREAIAYGYDSADGAARFNAMIFAKDFAQFTPAQITDLMLASGLLYTVDDKLRENTIARSVEMATRIRVHLGTATVIIPYLSLDRFGQIAKKPDGGYTVNFPAVGDVEFYAPDPDFREVVKEATAKKGFIQITLVGHDSGALKGRIFESMTLVLNADGSR